MNSDIPIANRYKRAVSLGEAFLCGALAGAALGIAFAPAPGSETRARLRARARTGRDQVSEVIEQGKTILEQQKRRAEELVNLSRTHVRDQARHVSKAVEEGRAAASDIRVRGQRALENIKREGMEAVADATSAYNEVRSRTAGSGSEGA